MWALGVELCGLAWQQLPLPTDPSCYHRSDDVLSSIFKTYFKCSWEEWGRERKGCHLISRLWEQLLVFNCTLTKERGFCQFFTVLFPSSHLGPWAALTTVVLALSCHAPVTSPRDLGTLPVHRGHSEQRGSWKLLCCRHVKAHFLFLSLWEEVCLQDLFVYSALFRRKPHSLFDLCYWLITQTRTSFLFTNWMLRE